MNIDDKLFIKTEQAADEIWWSLTGLAYQFLINAEKVDQLWLTWINFTGWSFD